MTLMTVPIIDMAPYWSGSEASKRALARQIDEACRDIGFLLISGHGGISPLPAGTVPVSCLFQR